MKRSTFWLVCTMMWLMGCASMVPGTPGEVRMTESKVNNTKQIVLSPGIIDNSSVRLGLIKLDSDSVFLVVAAASTVQSKEGVSINVDGKKTVLSAIDDLSDYDGQTGLFRKRYPISMKLVREMATGKQVFVRLDFNGQTYQEVDFTPNHFWTAKKGFIDFIAAVDGPTRTPSSVGH